MAAGTVAIDFDGVLHQGGRWIPGAPEAIRDLWQQDVLVIIHSCRANSPDGILLLEQTLAELGPPPVGPRGGRRLQFHVGPGKPHADAYIDDKAIRFTDWPATLAAIACVLP